MRVIIEVPDDRISNLFTTAIEAGDPVTTASKGGWCGGIYWQTRTAEPPSGIWYASCIDPKNWAGNFRIQIIEVDDESTGHETVHKVDRARVERGLGIMATKYGHLFEQITGNNIDATCADIFLQCVCFGEEKYA